MVQDSVCERASEFVSRLLRRGARGDFPWRRFKSPFKVLIAEILLQRTPAERVAEHIEEFLNKYPNPLKLALEDPSKLERELTPLGLSLIHI